MGGGTSRSTDAAAAADIRSLESHLASVGVLPQLRSFFHGLSSSTAPSTLSPRLVEECFQLRVQCSSFAGVTPELELLKQYLASAIVNTLFVVDKDGITWQGFLKGIEKCHQTATSSKLKIFLSFIYHLQKRAGLPITWSFTCEDPDQLDETSFSGHLSDSLLRDILLLCWLMGCDADVCTNEQELPNVEPILKSAQKACAATESLPIEKLYKWMLSSLPRLPFALTNYIQTQLRRQASKYQSNNAAASSTLEIQETDVHDSKPRTSQFRLLNQESIILRSGVAWAIGLLLPDSVGQKLVSYSFTLQEDYAFLLYRSASHGKGMNRFWANVEGYRGPVLMLIQGITTEGCAVTDIGNEKWLVGAFIKDGFDNKAGYYGSRECCIFALDPLLQPIRSTGAGTNFLYCSHHGNKSYFEQHKRNFGIGFGGDIGKERLWIDEDFMCITIRHHAIDKTYEPGHLVPHQGYATIKGNVLDIEVWGLGGTEARENQAKLHERKKLFEEQKRKVDMQSLVGNWADSPEKMMMDMVSNPTKVEREER